MTTNDKFNQKKLMNAFELLTPMFTVNFMNGKFEMKAVNSQVLKALVCDDERWRQYESEKGKSLMLHCFSCCQI